ncbi:MAG: permease [Paenibacillus macerans]|uniref:Putative permease family protein n=2 Tax=Paenibacillus macerans TaxID=44252 RepID=A0A090ZLV0_PAEMA|nr:permease [Paenibacillus macerans]KFN11240.1 putative permease family protein [Paenibacillus macerans]MCY7558902.1 permease [Paenibacillus macerans]MDU7472870.1 permease [Paenibacillus macerans]MEC0137979.1 permease [Paenibacillus macerans]MEC0150135.1 permease [Paenibacillus macerans]
MAWLQSRFPADLLTFKTMFISIFLEALPFILLGVISSSMLQWFVSERRLARIIPRNPLLGMLFASLGGMLFPICECGMVPVVRRLVAKGMPVYIATVFILSGPILNPVVLFATYTAFRNRPEVLYSRIGLAIIVSFVVGLIVYRFVRYNPLRLNLEALYDEGPESIKHDTWTGKFTAFFIHTLNEFFEMSKYLAIGALITAIIHTFVNTGQLAAYGQGPVSSHLLMSGFAYLLSICSTSDAFVASSFVGTFSAGSLITFLVLGPMLDLKGTLMLLSAFKTKFVVTLAVAIPATVLVFSIGLDQWLLR